MKSIIKTLFIVTLFAACSTTAQEKKSLLPDSSGDLAEIILLSDKATLDSAFKLSVDSIFAQATVGQPRSDEQIFNVLYADEDFFSGYFKKHHNIFILLTEQNGETLKKVLPAKFVDGMLATQQKNPGILGVKQETIFAQNQHIFVVLAQNKSELKRKLQNKREDLLQLAKEQENITGKRKMLGEIKASKDADYQKSLKDRGFGVRVPKSYRVAADKTDFVWIRKKITNEEKDMSIILFEAPYTTAQNLTTDSLLAVRNRYTKKYIPGEYEGSYMKYSTAIEPVRTNQNFKDKYGVEIRGWWDVKGDFMGGPSYLRAVVDEANKRIVFAEGFLFYPNESKTKSMRELEILVNTLSIK